VRLADGQHLRWQSLPRGEGLESVNVVGERFRLDALQDPSFAAGNAITLEREPANPYDSNAIAVWNAARTLQAGYIPRDDAKRLAKKLDRGERFRVLSIWETFEADRGRADEAGLCFFRAGTPWSALVLEILINQSASKPSSALSALSRISTSSTDIS